MIIGNKKVTFQKVFFLYGKESGCREPYKRISCFEIFGIYMACFFENFGIFS